MKRLLTFLCAILVATLPSIGLAGSSEAGHPALAADQVNAFANRVQQDLASRGAHVAIVARMGRDPSDLPPGVTYTHVSYWVYSRLTAADGSAANGYRVYNLYQRSDDPSRSHLVQDSPADFFAGARRLDAGIIIPDVRLQKKLLKVIASPTYARLHNASYSVLANPNTSQFQNCTEHTLDVMMSALYDTADIVRIKADIAAHFKPQVLQIGAFKRLLAPAASQALTTADHGTTIGTATFGSIARFMQANKLASEVYRLTPTSANRF